MEVIIEGRQMKCKFIPRSPKEELKEFISKNVTNEKKKKAILNFIEGKRLSIKEFSLAVRYLYATSLAVWIQSYSTKALAAMTDAQSAGLPKEVDQVLFKIQLICLGICVGVGIIMAMVAGFFRMIGLREEAKKRYMDAIAGMVMVLTAPLVLGLIATLVRGLLRLFPQYAVGL